MRLLKKFPTMKKWGVLSWLVTIALSVALAIGVFCTDKDMSQLATVCGFAWADTGVYTAAYAFKERAENKKKIAIAFVKEMACEYGIENVMTLAQSIIEG